MADFGRHRERVGITRLADITGLQIKPKDLLEGLEEDADAQRELAKFTDHGTQALEKLSKLDEQFRKGLKTLLGQMETAVPADEKLFAALEWTKKGDPDATRELQEEFDHQLDAKLARGLL